MNANIKTLDLMAIQHSLGFYTALCWMFLPFSVLVIEMRPAVANELPLVKDFTAAEKVARTKRVPILLLFISTGCSHCNRVS